MPHPLSAEWERVRRLARHTVSIGWLNGLAKIVRVQFHHSGLFVHFPYHPDMAGIVARCELPSGPKATVDMADTGGVTSHRVKYSHHVDGNCHFSQDGRHMTTVRNISTPLLQGDASQSHLFTVYIQGVEHFARMSANDYYRDERGPCHFDLIEEQPLGRIRIVGRWTPLQGLDIDTLKNPVKTRLRSGDEEEHIALAPPPGSPLDSHLLLINAYPDGPAAETENDPVLLFTAGFSPLMKDPLASSSFIALKYPVGSDTATLPSLDFLPTMRSD